MTTATSQPNIIFLLIDDMGYGDVAAHGNEVIHTPNFDALHHESVRFEKFCVSPTCAPTRAALMTGMHEFGSDVSHTALGRNAMNLETTTVAQVLKDAGYATGLFGKWHLGTDEAYRPENRGFDTALTCIGDTQAHHFDPVLLRNGKEEPHEGYRTDIFFDEAMSFIESHQEDPFFCYLPTYSPHTPLVVPEKWSDLYPDQEQKNFLGMVTNVDHNLGRLRQKLEDLELSENTIIVAMNDNGGTWGVDLFNGGMRGRKAHTLYGGIRAFSFWCWPGQWTPGVQPEMTGHVDVLPTFAELAGSDTSVASQQHRLEGFSLCPLLEGKDTLEKTCSERMMVHHRSRWNEIPEKSPRENADLHKYAYCSVRWNQYILMRVEACDYEECTSCRQIIERCKPGSPKKPYTENPDYYEAPKPGRWQLYDVEQDIYQTTDLAEQHPEIVEAMSDYYEAWWQRIWKR